MVTPANSIAYSYENPHDRFLFESNRGFSSQCPMARDRPEMAEDHSVFSRTRVVDESNFFSTIEAVKKYAVEFFSKIGPFVYLAVGFLAAGSYKLFGSLIKVQIDQMNIAAQQQIQQPQVQQPQDNAQTLQHHRHEHHVYHYYPQERRRSFSIPACDRMACERWNAVHSMGIVC